MAIWRTTCKQIHCMVYTYSDTGAGGWRWQSQGLYSDVC